MTIHSCRNETKRGTNQGIALRRMAVCAVVIGSPAWVSVSALTCAADAPANDPPKVEAATYTSAGSENALMAVARKTRTERSELFGGADGVVVLQVLPDTQAAAVGLRAGDPLLRYGGEPLDSPEGLTAATRRELQGNTVAVELLRDGRPEQIEVKAGRVGVYIATVAEPAVPKSALEPSREFPQAGLYAQPVLVPDPGMHTAPISGADVDRTGRLAVTGSTDKTVRLWALDGDLAEPLSTLRLPAGPGDVGKIFAVAINPAGNLIAAGGRTGGVVGKYTIYLFTREGHVVKRIDGLTNLVIHLAFSPDGRWLAAGLERNGIRIFDRESGWASAVSDTDCSDPVHGLAFAKDGRLATTCRDGQVRVYDASFRRITRQPMTAGKHPAGIAFHPEGDRLAVGFRDTPAVVLLDGRTLKPRPRQPDLADIDKGNLITVAWSRDGSILFAAGAYDGQQPSPVFAWPDAGTGARRTAYSGTLNTVMSLRALPNDGLLVAAKDPHLAVVGAKRAVRVSPLFDARAQHSNFSVSADGLQIDFGFRYGGEADRHRFDLAKLTDTAGPALAPLAAADGRTAAPRQTGLPVEHWANGHFPTLAGTPLPLDRDEISFSLAIHPDGARFVLGTRWSLRSFDATGEPLWRRAMPGTVRAVNITGDGRLVVAACSDGTIRWHRMDDGRELLALYPMTDRKNWVAWSPEGFYGATAGAYGILKWHVNRGWDRLADAYQVYQFRYLRREDALPLVLQEGETARALGLADMSRARREVQRLTKAALPPGARLYFVGVGIREYGETAHQLHLKYADKDVSDVATALLATQSGLYADVSPQVLPNEDATRSKLLAALDAVGEQMAAGAGGDLAVLLFSGHGALLGPKGSEQYYLLPYEVDTRTKQQIRNTAISVADLRSRLAELGRHGRVLALLDACRSGAATNADGALAVDGGALRGALAGLPNVAVLTSSDSATPSFERDDWQNGAFTEVLLRALGKEGDSDHDGLISMTELTDYLSENLPRLTHGLHPQSPGVEVHYQGELFVSGP